MALHLDPKWEDKATSEYGSELGEGISEGAHGYINGAADFQLKAYGEFASMKLSDFKNMYDLLKVIRDLKP